MQLPFRYQFILAPFTIVLVLGCLVAYTFVELSNIYRENETTRLWEVTADRIQTAIATAIRLNQIIHEMPAGKDAQEDEQFFNYLEQAGIVSDNLFDPYLLDRLSPERRQKIIEFKHLFNAPERTDPAEISQALTGLLPELENEYKIIAAQRRTAFIENHRSLLVVNARMTTVLMSALILCIALATGLALWGYLVMRRRLKRLTSRSFALRANSLLPIPDPPASRDELDELENCLVSMTSRLFHTVSMENVLRGVEKERRRIAMDIHDGVLADLTAVDRKLDKWNATAASGEITALRGDVDDIITSLRNTIDDLHPQVLDTLGLESALESLLARHSASNGFPKYHFEFDKSIESVLETEQKINLFRIVAEAINNVIKHAHCRRVEICLRIAQKLVLTVEDDGVGMPENRTVTGHGCANITERAGLIGAEVRWRSSRYATGTCLEVTVPIGKVV